MFRESGGDKKYDIAIRVTGNLDNNKYYGNNGIATHVEYDTTLCAKNCEHKSDKTVLKK